MKYNPFFLSEEDHAVIKDLIIVSGTIFLGLISVVVITVVLISS